MSILCRCQGFGRLFSTTSFSLRTAIGIRCVDGIVVAVGKVRLSLLTFFLTIVKINFV